jgi:hypothetical protein
MPGKLPVVVIDSPQPNAYVGSGPVTVGGTVTVPSLPEPIAIDAVTVIVPGAAGRRRRPHDCIGRHGGLFQSYRADRRSPGLPHDHRRREV